MRDSKRSITPRPHPKDRGPNLTRITDVRREMSALYRQAKFGDLSPLDYTRLTRGLEILADVIERETVEAKIGELEKQLQEGVQWADPRRVIELRASRKN
jgi:hypothetical protein